MTTSIHMVDLHSQYLEIKGEVDEAVSQVLDSTAFIRGEQVDHFESELAAYLGGAHCIGVGNGTDALQIALMAAGVGPGDEVITSPFTFVATAEAAAVLGATPVFVDIDPATFNLDPANVAEAISPRTRAIIPVHLFGQPADLEPILIEARRHDIVVIEDNAQSIGATYRGRPIGFLGDMGCLSFFPSKNLGAFGDGGAILTERDDLAARARMISNHGSTRKYHNEVVGVNSRLDTLQAAILRVKLRHLDSYIERRRSAADRYDELLSGLDAIELPVRADYGTHVFHQYTIRVRDGLKRREGLQKHLASRGVPSAIYYPVPLHRLPVFKSGCRVPRPLDHAETASDDVLSLPMHTHLTDAQLEHITDAIQAFFR